MQLNQRGRHLFIGRNLNQREHLFGAQRQFGQRQVEVYNLNAVNFANRFSKRDIKGCVKRFIPNAHGQATVRQQPANAPNPAVKAFNNKSNIINTYFREDYSKTAET